MRALSVPVSPDPTAPFHLSEMLLALALLMEADDCARRLDREALEFAVELCWLRAAGISPGVLRWLLGQGHLIQFMETTRPEAKQRSFRRVSHLGLAERSCFLLTESGVGFARTLKELHSRNAPAKVALAQDEPLLAAPPKPCWDGLLRELRWNGALVKQFLQPAGNQETILAAFQEEDWPGVIDDPLSPKHEQDPKDRLRNTVRHLNRCQRQTRIRFRACCNGQAVSWTVAVSAGAFSGRPANEERP